jgi:hypothetical protein
MKAFIKILYISIVQIIVIVSEGLSGIDRHRNQKLPSNSEKKERIYI